MTPMQQPLPHMDPPDGAPYSTSGVYLRVTLATEHGAVQCSWTDKGHVSAFADEPGAGITYKGTRWNARMDLWADSGWNEDDERARDRATWTSVRPPGRKIAPTSRAAVAAAIRRAVLVFLEQYPEVPLVAEANTRLRRLEQEEAALAAALAQVRGHEENVRQHYQAWGRAQHDAYRLIREREEAAREQQA